MFEDNDVVDMTDRFNELVDEYALSENTVCDFDGWDPQDLMELRDVVVQVVELLGVE